MNFSQILNLFQRNYLQNVKFIIFRWTFSYHIAYAPETSPIVKEIMESVKNKLNTHIQGYNSEEETITMLQLANKPHVAVIFPEAYINMTKLPKKVQFTLRFKS